MSLHLDIQQKVMDIFVDSIREEGVDVSTIEKELGYTPHDKLTEPSLVQSFAPSIATVEGSFGQRLATLTFTLEYLTQATSLNSLANTIETFATAIRLDPTLGGIVLQCSAAVRTGEVVNHIDEPAVVTISMTATFDDGDINQSGVPLEQDNSKIDLLPVTGRASDISVSGTVLAEESTVIPGAIEFTSTAQVFPFWAWDTAGFSDVFPLDLSVPDLRVWRFLIYLQPPIDRGTLNLNLRFGSIAGSNDDSVTYNFVPTIGWNEFVVDLDTEPTTISGTFDPTAMLSLQMSLFAFAFDMDGFQVKRIFQYPRDRGTSGLSLGF